MNGVELAAALVQVSLLVITVVNAALFLAALKLYTEIMKERAQQRRHDG